MADIKISALTAAASATGAMELEVNDASSSKKVTVNQLQDAAIGTTNGLIARTAANTVAARAITQATGIIVSNGNGVSGDPTIAADTSVLLKVFLTRYDNGTLTTGTSTISLSNGPAQTLTKGSGSGTIAISGKPSTDTWHLDLELINGGAGSITWPTVSWLVGDGTVSSTFADMGVTLAASGVNTVLLWADGSGTVYGKAG